MGQVQGRLDLLQAIQAGTLTVTQVYAADRARQLDTLTGERAALGRPLWPAVRSWLATRPGPTGLRYGGSLAALERTGALGASAPVESLVRVDWPALRAAWAPSPASWNHLRRALSAFLTAQLGDVHHPFRRQVLKRFGKPAREVARVPELSPELFWRIVHAAVQASLRHTSGAMTRRYTMQKERETVADALAGVLLGSAVPQLVPLSENGRDARSA